MSACCENGIINLGCINHCDTVETTYTAAATATYVISIVGSGGYLEVSGTIGNEITFANPFNEDSVTVFQILRDGEPVSVSGKDCFQITVNAGVDLT